MLKRTFSTDREIQALKPAERHYDVRDSKTRNLIVRVGPRNSRGEFRRTFCLLARFPGKKQPTRHAFGEYGELTLEEARKNADTWRALIRDGKDPREETRREKEHLLREREAAEQRRGRTFGAYAEREIARRSKLRPRPRRVDADAAEIRRVLIPAWGDRPLHEIRPKDGKELFTALVERAPFDASNQWRHSVGIFKRAVFDGVIEVSPFASLDKRMLFPRGSLAPRQRVLSDDEVFALWRAAGRMGFVVRGFYRLLVLTGVRLSELREASWSELHPELRRVIRDAGDQESGIDWDTVPAAWKAWTIPADRFKSDAEHMVALSDDACRVLETLPRFAGTDWIFTFDGKRPAWVGDKVKKTLDRHMLAILRALAKARGDDPTKVTLPGWKNHDLRRVIRTGMAELGVDDRVAELVIGHGPRDPLARTYELAKRRPQVREAMELWADRVMVVVRSAPIEPEPTADVVEMLHDRVRGRA